MCIGKHQYARVEVCTVGNLKPGQKYRTPERETLMVINLGTRLPGMTAVVNVETGIVGAPVPNTTKLGHDREGRLYAGRYLNRNQAWGDEERVSLAECLPAPEAVVLDDDADRVDLAELFAENQQ